MNYSVNHKRCLEDTITLLTISAYLKTTNSLFQLHGIKLWDFGTWKKVKPLIPLKDIKKKYYLVVSISITELFFPVVVTKTSNFGMLKVNANTPLKKTITPIGFQESDILHQENNLISLLLDGTEDLRFGPTNSNSFILSKVMMPQSMLYLLLQLDLISVLVVKIMLLKDGILEVSKNQFSHIKLKVKLMILNSTQLTNGLLPLLIKVSKSGIFKMMLEYHSEDSNTQLP